MKKLLSALLYFMLINVANSCETYMDAKKFPVICSYQDIKALITKYKKIGPQKYNRENQFSDLAPDDVKEPKTTTYREVISFLKVRLKEKKSFIEYECEQIAGSANNSWSARKIYKKCLKNRMSL